jgi:cell division protease FtsH
VGLRRTSLALSPEEKRIVAYHEAGHSLLAHLLPQADPLHKVSILPTGMALGATQQLPEQERQLEQRPYLEDALAVRLGGRAAEILVFGVPSTGAQDDLHAATDLAGRMVREWGMSERLGSMAWGPHGPVFLGEDLIQSRDYSDQTAHVIDTEIQRILSEQALRAQRVLASHRPALDAVAAALVEQETLDGTAVQRIVATAEGPPVAPYPPGQALPANGTTNSNPVPERQRKGTDVMRSLSSPPHALPHNLPAPPRRDRRQPYNSRREPEG